MGDRANIVMDDAGERVFFYTHWDGSELPSIAQDGLRAGESRWTDPSYLARIVFCSMVKGQEGETTGYGISTRLCDNSYPLLVIDTTAQQVRFDAADGVYSGLDDTVGCSFSFKDYCALNFDGRQQWRVVAGLPDDE